MTHKETALMQTELAALLDRYRLRFAVMAYASRPGEKDGFFIVGEAGELNIGKSGMDAIVTHALDIRKILVDGAK